MYPVDARRLRRELRDEADRTEALSICRRELRFVTILVDEQTPAGVGRRGLEELHGHTHRIEDGGVLGRDDRDRVGLDVDLEIGVDRRYLEPLTVWFENLGDPIHAQRDVDLRRRAMDDLDDRCIRDLRRLHGEDEILILVIEQDRSRHHLLEGRYGIINIGSGHHGDRIDQGEFSDVAIRLRQHRAHDGVSGRLVELLSDPRIVELDIAVDDLNCTFIRRVLDSVLFPIIQMGVDGVVVDGDHQVDIDMIGEAVQPRNETTDHPTAALIHRLGDSTVHVCREANGGRIELISGAAHDERYLLTLEIRLVGSNDDGRIVLRETANIEPRDADVPGHFATVRRLIDEVDHEGEE